MVCTVTAILHKTLNDYNIDSLCLNHGNLAIHVIITLNEPRREKTGLRGFRPGPTQTGLYSHRSRLEA